MTDIIDFAHDDVYGGYDIPTIRQEFQRVTAQRDELLAALKQVRSEMRARGSISGATQDAADAAIAKSEGQV